MLAALDNLRWGYRPSASSSVFDCRPPVADKGHSAVVRLPLARPGRGALSLHAGQGIPVFREGEMARRRKSFDNKNLRAVTVKALTRFFGSALACGQMIGAAVTVTPEMKSFRPRVAGSVSATTRLKLTGSRKPVATAGSDAKANSPPSTGQYLIRLAALEVRVSKPLKIWEVAAGLCGYAIRSRIPLQQSARLSCFSQGVSAGDSALEIAEAPAVGLSPRETKPIAGAFALWLQKTPSRLSKSGTIRAIRGPATAGALTLSEALYASVLRKPNGFLCGGRAPVPQLNSQRLLIARRFPSLDTETERAIFSLGVGVGG